MVSEMFAWRDWFLYGGVQVSAGARAFLQQIAVPEVPFFGFRQSRVGWLYGFEYITRETKVKDDN